MPWKGKTVEELREEFAIRALTKQKSKAALCREYGISRPTGDKWIERYEEGLSLSDRSRAPLNTPNRIAPEMEELIIQMRLAEPAIGAKKIHRMMINRNIPNPPAVSTINNVLRRNGLISKQDSQAAQHYKRFQKELPNELWQADFKGNFLLQNKQRCYPLSILDDCTRFGLCGDAKENEQFLSTKESFELTFRTFGIPDAILCDNGHPWGSSQSTSITKFEVWLMEHGILTIHTRIKHPQCQGKVERFNGSYKRERLRFYTPTDMEDAQKCREEYLHFYNNERPHEALDMDVPADHYRPSDHEYNDVVSGWEYESGGILCNVKSSGYITYEGQGFFLSEGLGGKQVMLFPNPEHDGILDVVFREFSVAKLSLVDRTIQSRRVYLRHNDPRRKV